MQKTKYLRVGDVFPLTLDGTTFHPLAVAQMAMEMEKENIDNWQYGGKMIIGQHTDNFKLVLVNCLGWSDLLDKLAATGGTIPVGQWMKPLKDALLHFHGQWSSFPIGLADASYVCGNLCYFLYICNGRVCFYNVRLPHTFNNWFWLMEEAEKTS